MLFPLARGGKLTESPTRMDPARHQDGKGCLCWCMTAHTVIFFTIEITKGSLKELSFEYKCLQKSSDIKKVWGTKRKEREPYLVIANG